MAIANDVYQIRMEQEYLGQQLVNNFWYQIGSTPTDENASDLLNEFLGTVEAVLDDLMSDQWEWTSLQCVNWRDTSDFAINVTGDVGTDSATGILPSFVCLSYGFAPNQPGRRWAFHRFSGLTTQIIIGNGTADPAGRRSSVGTALGTNLEGADGLYVPVQIRTSTLPLMGAGQPFAIRGLTNGGGLNWSSKPGTQNTRKAGVGS